MKLLKQILLFISCTISILATAQNTNIFLKRDFWKTKPTIELINKKIKEHHNPTELNSNGFDAVTYAILAQAPISSIKHLLLIEGNDVDKLTHDRRTYIFWAAYKGNLELVKYLIDNNARLDLKDSHNFSPLTFAAATGQTNMKIYDIFIENGINIKTDLDEKGANALLLLVPYLKDFKIIDYFISKGLSLKNIDNQGNGVFNYTAKKGNKEMLELLLKKGVSYKELNKNGGNAILLASINSKNSTLAFFKYLENLGINPNITNNEGRNPIHNLAYKNKNLNIFEYFIEKGVDVNQIDNTGETALLKATSNNSLEVIQLLASKTKNINHTNKDGKSALTNAIRNNLKIIIFLLKKGADISVVDAKGNYLNYYLFQTFNAKKIAAFKQKLSLLKTQGLKIEKTQKDGNTLFHLAVEKYSIDMLDFIKKYKIDINARNKNDLSALQKAVLVAKSDKIIKYLIAQGADKNIKTAFDETLYDLAKENEALKNTDINFLK